MKTLRIIFLLLFLISPLWAVSGTATIDDGELISIGQETSFVEVVKMLELLSQQYEGKKIVNLSQYTGAIGLPITHVYWKDALSLIINYNNLTLEELPGSFLIKDIEVQETSSKEAEGITPDTKQVRIHATFFKADKSFLNSIGIDWSTLYNDEVVASVGFKGASKVQDNIFQATGATTIESGNVSINVDALLNVIESRQRGAVLARPNLIVVSGKKGLIQVGDDYSIKQKDESGNITDKFFSAGMILEVTPTVVQSANKEAIHLIARVEKSAAVPGELSTVIHKSKSETEVLLFDGEETVIGGLYDTEDTKVRNGVPLLKDLPWWFLGIRYLFGFNSTEQTQREMIIILKAEIMDSVDLRRENIQETKDQIKAERLLNRQSETLFSEGEDDE